jgi:hypothetical protein
MQVISAPQPQESFTDYIAQLDPEGGFVSLIGLRGQSVRIPLKAEDSQFDELNNSMLQLEQMAPQKGRRTSILQPHEINSNRFKIHTVDYQEGEFH